MTPQIAKNILFLLDRVQMTGKEAMAWCEACSALNEIIAAPAAPMPNHIVGVPAVPAAAPVPETPAA